MQRIKNKNKEDGKEDGKEDVLRGEVTMGVGGSVEVRRFKVLRVSVTDRCNFGCKYCSEGDELGGVGLKEEEYIELIKLLHEELVLEKVRITGGEPLLYKGLARLIRGVKSLGIKALTLTTNGYNLADRIMELKGSGLDGLNVSCDALGEEEFEKITGGGKYKDNVLEGIEKSMRLGFKVKVNATILRGLNEGEILKLLKYFGKRGVVVRFLEVMQMGHLYNNHERYFYGEESILGQIKKEYELEELGREAGKTSKYWKTKAEGYKFGIISNTTSPFCKDCNRLRLDHKGNIYGCLSEERSFNIRGIRSREKLRKILEEALKDKQEYRFKGSALGMQQIGG